MKKSRYLLYLLLSVPLLGWGKDILITSPNGKIRLTLQTEGIIAFKVADANNQLLFSSGALRLQTDKGILGEHPKLTNSSKHTSNTVIKPQVPLQDAIIPNEYNALKLHFKGNYALEFRAYNDGIAYRFVTNLKDSIVVVSENLDLDFPQETWVSWAQADEFKNDYQVVYQPRQLTSVKAEQKATLPLLFKKDHYSILFSETNLYDYPALFFKSTGKNQLKAVFPKQPISFKPQGDRSMEILKEAAYIAKTAGKRSFPWRFMVIGNDKVIAGNNMVAKLSDQPMEDFSWVKPGQVTWEWWHNAHVYGVDFKSGYNQDTYQYYIDFAAKNGIPYIVMDEGWAKTTLNPFEPNPTINLHELIKYGNARGVKIILWFTWLAVERNFDIFETLAKWGIAGMKIDFMDRSDQWMVNYYERVAKEAAKHHILIDFHGAFKPAGLEMKYPNVLSYEGVMGMEANIGGGVATPNNNLFLPFVRNAVGAMDYTPGAMFSVHPKDYRGNWVNTMSIGSRAHQLAMYVVFKSGLQMLADNPYNYNREKQCLDFITSVPVTWDETKVLDAIAPEYVVIARRKGENWFVGAMTNSTARKLQFKADFLKRDKKYKITLIKDGINANVQAMDYKQITEEIMQDTVMEIDMVADGGWVARIELQN